MERVFVANMDVFPQQDRPARRAVQGIDTVVAVSEPPTHSDGLHGPQGALRATWMHLVRLNAIFFKQR
jgi:hypothetical protein